MKKENTEKTALITGVTGQDGAYLAQLLLEKGYFVHGIKRRSSSFNTERIDHLYKDTHEDDVRFRLHFGDLTDSLSLTRIIKEVEPDEIYNLGAMSHVQVSFELPEYTADVDAIGALRILEAVRFLGFTEKTKVYQASTSELYGLVQEVPQNEDTPFYPRSPYGAAKLYAYWITINYREAYNMFAVNGILFNHESPLRGETFVTRKITRGIARVVKGLQRKIHIGNLDARRDWGHAKDYVYGMWLMLQQEKPEDFVLATGVTTSVREFIILCYDQLGIELKFQGSGLEETASVEKCNNPKYQIQLGQEVLAIDSRYFRPTEVDLLIGDASKAKRKLNWKLSYNLDSIVRDMISNDLRLVEEEQVLRQHL